MLKKHILFGVLLSGSALASTTVPQTYRSSDNQYHAVKITSGLNASGNPVVNAYKGNDGQWHPTTVQVQACGLDADGHPTICSDSVTSSLLANYIPITEIGSVNGVAGLDSVGQLTSPISTTSGLWNNPASVDSIVRIQPTVVNSGRWAIDPDGIQVGGDFVADVQGQGAPNGARGSLGSERINCHPYGNYDAGACLVIADTAQGRENARMGIGAALEQSTSLLANYEDFENVGIGVNMASAAARLVLSGVSYDATHVWMPGCGPTDTSGKSCVPLTKAQVAQLRDGMTITTNSYDPTITRVAPGSSKTLPVNGLYHAFVSDWDKTQADGSSKYIIIGPGWIAYGGASSAAQQIPDTTKLDTYWTAYNTPTVLLGAENKDFGQVEQIEYNPALDASGVPTSSLAHKLEYNEVNMVNYALQDYMVSVHGLTMAYSAPNSKKPTSDSYGVFVAGGFGGGGGSLLRLTGDGGEAEIDANGLKLFAPYSVGSDAGNNAEIAEFIGQADGNHIRMVSWLNRENSGANGWTNTSLNLGGWIDGTIENTKAGTVLGGSPLARISWDYGTNLGGMDLIANNGTDILRLKGDGSTNALGALNAAGQLSANANFVMRGTQYFQTSDGTNQFSASPAANGNLVFNPLQSGGQFTINAQTSVGNSLTVSGQITTGSYALSSLPTGMADGSHVWCNSCVLNGIKGVEAYWHSSANKWTDGQNNSLSE